MSFDELPPDAQPPRLEEGETRASDRGESASDAPPARPARQRRAPRTGTDAASADPTNASDPPARSTRRKPTEQGKKETGKETKQKGRKGEDETIPDPQSASDNLPATTGHQEPQPGRRRSARETTNRKPEGAETNTVTPPVPPVGGATGAVSSEESAAAEATPAAAPRRRSRRNAPPTPDDAASAARTEAPAPTPEIASAEPPTEPAVTARPSRRRSIRAEEGVRSQEPGVREEKKRKEKKTEEGRGNNAGAQPVTPDTNPAPDDEAALNPQPSTGNQETAPPAGRSRSRSGRSRRKPGGEAEQHTEGDMASVGAAPTQRREEEFEAAQPEAVAEGEELAAAEAIAAETLEADNEADGIEGEAGTEGTEGRGRRRRNRRNSRTRRDNRVPGEETAPEAVAAPVAEAVSVEPPVTVVVEDPIDLSVGAHLIARHGVPQIHINGVAFPPVLFFGNMEGAKNAQRVLAEVRRAAKAGVHLYSTLIELPCPLSEAHYVLDEIDARLRALLDADPNGHVMPRLVFVPARGWKREYPTDISVYSDGTNGDPSLTSERFWQEGERALQMLIEHIGAQTYGERVFGYHLERGEWFQPADQGYDRSMANRDAFRDWLREKYKNSLILLRAAWYNGDVQFHTAEIPPPLGKPNPQRAFYETRRERSVIDFNEFTSETTANRLTMLASAVKKASRNNALVSVCYGYTLEFGHGFSGHLALDRLLASPHIDLICGPPSYRDRKPTGAASFPAPVDSLRLHGKLWLSEDDTKTYLAPAQQDPDDFNPRLSDRFATDQAQERAIGRSLTTNTGIGWMDLWGEGWLDDESIWERISAYTARLELQQREPSASGSPEVVVLIDEKSLLHVQKGEVFFRRLTNGLRDTLQRSGAAYGLYLQSDLLNPNFPTDARLYLFLNPYRLTAEQRTAVKEKLQRDNKTLAWLYAPGSCDERPTGGMGVEEVATGTVGLTLRQQAWNSEIGSRILDPNHALTERLAGRELGTKERLNPSFYVDDPEAVALAEYQGSGLPSIGARNFGNWKSVFVGDPVLPLELLRGICRYAGVHLYVTGGEDVVSIGNGWITVHANRDGQRTLRLPAPRSLYDMHERRIVAENTREYRYFLRMGTTRTFCVGTRDQFARLDLPNLDSPQPRNRPPREREPGERTTPEQESERMSDASDGREREESGAEFAEDRTAEQTAEPTLPTQSSYAPLASESDAADGTAREPQTTERETAGFNAAALPATAAERNENNENSAAEAQSETEEMPTIEPFPQPRRTSTPLSSLATAPPSLRADLETLKAVLEMEMPDEEEDADETDAPPAPPLPLPKDGLPGLESVLGLEAPGSRRRRRRGGRGRGRKNENGEIDTPDANAPDEPSSEL